MIEAPWQVRLVKMADVLDHVQQSRAERQPALRTASLAASLGYDHHPSLTIAVGALRAVVERPYSLHCFASSVSR
jgi:hypothetical protein